MMPLFRGRAGEPGIKSLKTKEYRNADLGENDLIGSCAGFRVPLRDPCLPTREPVGDHLSLPVPTMGLHDARLI